MPSSVLKAAALLVMSVSFNLVESAPYLTTITKRQPSFIGALTLLRGGDVQMMQSLSDIEAIIISSQAEDRLVVLDFTANNCPPCNMIAPIYLDLSELDEFSTVQFLKVNVNDCPDVAERYGVDGWPTFLLIKNGEVVDSVVGGQAAKAGLYGLVAKHR